MPSVTALYRYPVKGFTPQPVEHIVVLPGGRVAGDRVLNFRFADAPVADTAWCRKYHGVVLANTPGLARLKVRFASATGLTVQAGARILADDSLDDAGRQRRRGDRLRVVAGRKSVEGAAGRLPLKLVGDGTVALPGQPGRAGYVASRERSLCRRIARRCRSRRAALPHNIVIEWRCGLGRAILGGRQGARRRCRVRNRGAKVRCLATHANPRTGERDLEVMQSLVKMFAQKDPTFGIGMLSEAGGRSGGRSGRSGSVRMVQHAHCCLCRQSAVSLLLSNRRENPCIAF